MIHPDIYDTVPPPKNKLEEDLYASKSGPDACVVAYVSKMFAVSTKDLPENKKRALTAEEMREKAREARAARQTAGNGETSTEPDRPIDNEASKPAEVPEELKATETVLGFARLYSGTIRVGTTVFALLPKYTTELSPTHPNNAKYFLTAKVEGLYVMMGRELVPVSKVHAGNIFAIKGLESKVWRSATLCAPREAGIDEDTNPEDDIASLINLGAVNRAVNLSHRLSYTATSNPLSRQPPSSALL